MNYESALAKQMLLDAAEEEVFCVCPYCRHKMGGFRLFGRVVGASVVGIHITDNPSCLMRALARLSNADSVGNSIICTCGITYVDFHDPHTHPMDCERELEGWIRRLTKKSNEINMDAPQLKLLSQSISVKRKMIAAADGNADEYNLCLFCRDKFKSIWDCLVHMKKVHAFNPCLVKEVVYSGNVATCFCGKSFTGYANFIRHFPSIGSFYEHWGDHVVDEEPKLLVPRRDF